MPASSIRSARALGALLVVMALGLSACGGDDATVGDPTGTTPPEETTPVDETTPPETSDIGSTGITLTATNFAFTPPNPTVAAGETITFRNANPNTPHSFTVEETDIDEVANGGDSVDVVIELDPGEYDFHCEFHSEMQGTLTVT